MNVVNAEDKYPSAWHPIEFYKFKKNFQPKPAPPRKKPANSFLQLSPAKFTEAFGLTISPPTLGLGGGENFIFCDGEWKRPNPKSKRQARKSQVGVREDRKCSFEEKGTKFRPRPPVASEVRSGVGSPENPDFQRNSCPQDLEWHLAQCRKKLREQNDRERQELEDLHRKKLQECQRCHRQMEDALRSEHQAKLDAQQSQVDALLIKCSELKGENNLLHIKVSKMMDMLAECAAEVNLQEAELAQVAQTLQKKKKKPRSDSSFTSDEEPEECGPN